MRFEGHSAVARVSGKALVTSGDGARQSGKLELAIHNIPIVSLIANVLNLLYDAVASMEMFTHLLVHLV